MGKAVQIRFEGMRELLDMLARAPDSIRREVRTQGEKCCKGVVRIAKSVVPVRTGYLRSKIDYMYEGQLSWVIVADTDYAGFPEYGTRFMTAQPYMRPALAEMQPQFLHDVVVAVDRWFSLMGAS